MSQQQFEWKESQGTKDKIVLTVYGAKGRGKTTALMGLSGRKYVLCFDEKADRIKESQYASDPSITVLDGSVFLREAEETGTDLTVAGKKTVEWVQFLLGEIKKKGDANWIVFDFLPKWVKACELMMRADHGLGATEGFKNLSWWEDRNNMIRSTHLRCMGLVTSTTGRKCGVGYTTYIKLEVLKQRDGETLDSFKKANFHDIIEQVSDVVLFADKVKNKEGKIDHVLEVESNKFHVKGAKDGLASAADGEILVLSDGVRLRQLLSDL